MANERRSELRSALSTLRLSSRREFAVAIEAEGKQPQYTEFSIPKRSGGVRKITRPDEVTARVQANIRRLLNSAFRPPSAVHGFVENRSIVTNATAHIGCVSVLNIDLRDYFDTMHSDFVFNSLVTELDTSEAVARTIVDWTCHSESLPQGSPASPILSNIGFAEVDRRLQNIASLANCTYTRFADDLSFSASSGPIPSELALAADSGGSILALGPRLLEELGAIGMQVNYKKLRLHNASARIPVVTGIRVGSRLDVNKKLLKRMDGIAYLIERYGWAYCDSRHRLSGGNGRFKDTALGLLAYIQQVRGPGDEQARKWAKTLTGQATVGSEEEYWLPKLLRSVVGEPVFKRRLEPPRPREEVLALSIDETSAKTLTITLSEEATLPPEVTLRPFSPVIDPRGNLLGSGSELSSQRPS